MFPADMCSLSSPCRPLNPVMSFCEAPGFSLNSSITAYGEEMNIVPLKQSVMGKSKLLQLASVELCGSSYVLSFFKKVRQLWWEMQ